MECDGEAFQAAGGNGPGHRRGVGRRRGSRHGCWHRQHSALAVPVRALSQRTADEFAAKNLNGTPSFLIGKTGGKLTDIDLGDGTGAAAVAAIQSAIG